MLDDEREWLAAIVSRPSDETVKLAYADWLQEHGADDRAQFLRSIVEAARVMDIERFAHLDINHDPEWLELTGFWILRELAAERRLNIKDYVLNLTRPALRMIKNPGDDTEIPRGTSKIGGLPDLPPDFAWPKGGECRANFYKRTEGVEELAGFLAQVNFADIAHTQAARNLPRVGLLSFFCYQDLENDAPDTIGVKAVFFQNVTELVRTEPPGILTEGNTTIHPIQRLTFLETLDLPDIRSSSGGPWQGALSEHPERPNEQQDDPEVYESIRDYNFMNMFGYARGGSGDDPTPDQDHINLIVIKNVGECQLYIHIHKDDLAALQFDKIKLVWVDFFC